MKARKKVANWRITRRTDEYIEMTNIDNGAMKKVALASDSQWGYLESLRAKYTNKIPLKNRPTAFAAKKAINKLLEKKEKLERQQRLI